MGTFQWKSRFRAKESGSVTQVIYFHLKIFQKPRIRVAETNKQLLYTTIGKRYKSDYPIGSWSCTKHNAGVVRFRSSVN